MFLHDGIKPFFFETNLQNNHTISQIIGGNKSINIYQISDQFDLVIKSLNPDKKDLVLRNIDLRLTKKDLIE